MYINNGVDHRTRAQMLVCQLVDEHDATYGVGSMTCSIYDTAWVSMITKSAEGQRRWLFPTAFDYLLKTQHPDGGWHTSLSDIDGILNTLAALLALCKHIAAPYQFVQGPKDDLQHRHTRAVYYLEAKLSQWDVPATVSSDFEILVPKLLELLAAEGVEFHFAGREDLDSLKAKSSAKYSPSLLYSMTRSFTARSLEGLVGEVDFDRVSGHKICGSIMASPASTAAYLMHSSTWDAEAEDYLTHVLSIRDEHSAGGVPSQYPTTVFEITQALSVLLASGFSHEELGISRLESAANFLEACLSLDAGVTGSAPYIESDADSTAYSLLTLCKLGRIPNPQGLIVRFETKDYFKTFTQDRNPTFRTNCLVLKALLDLMPGNREQGKQIEKTLRFIINCWWTTSGRIEDPLNTSMNYTTMIMVDCLVRLLDLWEQGFAPILDDPVLKDKTFICLYQALTRTLQDQSSNGSWGSDKCCETTAYAVLALNKMTTLSSAPCVKTQIVLAIEKARKYLANNFRPLSEPGHVWQGKTAVGSSILFQVYVLAALQIPLPNAFTPRSIESRFEISVARVAIQTKYYARQSWFARVPEWQIQACLVESQLFLRQLREVRYAVFPKSQLEDDQYFETIPFIWLAACNFDRRFTGPEFLFQMMIASFLTRQLDEYITHYIAEAFAGCLFEVEDLLQDIFDELEHSAAKDQCFCNWPEPSATSATASMAEARSVLHRYVSHILNHPYVLMASYRDQGQLRTELLAYMQSRISQLPDQPPEGSSEQSKFRTDSRSDQTHHSYTLAFLSCLVGNQSVANDFGLRYDFLDTPEQQYLTLAMCRHLSIVNYMSSTVSEETTFDTQQARSPVKSRISNLVPDLGDSISTLSASSSSSTYSNGDMSPMSATSSKSSTPSTSLPSEEFLKPRRQSISQLTSQTLQLTRLLSHERRCLNVCLQSLDAAGINQRTANVLGLFVDVSELSELIFKDPNIGSYYQPTTAVEVIEQACLLQPAPTPPTKAAGRGSVANARAALLIEPLNTERGSSRGSSRSDRTISRRASPLPPKVTDIIPMHREFNFNRPVPTYKTHARRTSRSSIEMSRIERIMSDMGDSTLNSTSSKPSSRGSLPIPKISPILNNRPQARPRAATAGTRRSLYALSNKSPITTQPKRLSSFPPLPSLTPIPTATNTITLKLARLRPQTHRKLNIKAASKVEDEQTEAGEEAKQRAAFSLQSRATAEAVRAVSVIETTPPIPSQKVVKRMKSQGTLGLRRRPSRGLAAGETREMGDGWVRAPPPVPTKELVGMVGVKEGEGQGKGTLKRASRLGVPRLKLPF